MKHIEAFQSLVVAAALVFILAGSGHFQQVQKAQTCCVLVTSRGQKWKSQGRCYHQTNQATDQGALLPMGARPLVFLRVCMLCRLQHVTQSQEAALSDRQCNQRRSATLEPALEEADASCILPPPVTWAGQRGWSQGWSQWGQQNEVSPRVSKILAPALGRVTCFLLPSPSNM